MALRKWVYVASILLTLTLAIILYARTVSSSETDSNESIVFYVNKEPVTRAEFQLVLSELRPSVYSYFTQKYGVTDSPEFWSADHGGEVPARMLKQSAIDYLIRLKVESLSMKANGMIEDISYEKLQKDWTNENEKRKEAVKLKQPIYGPQQFTLPIYYRYIQAERVEHLKKKLNEAAVSEEEIQSYYQDNKDSFSADQSANELKDKIRTDLRDAKYSRLLDRLVKAADVEIINKSYVQDDTDI
ncbi:hypothetical protein [Paenibacillus sacheonensis]|uniref:Uncharacterized protein n=1 Tax=Paenibacillus sacheonensis TaxID=742054 RepID=A0A7X4YUY2_9BACL|nr:hypothetical protein [Paenibacillus sacheonensis]MBM7569202.1 hypothetical protein [Paenibacillus sacheonensis]NBC73027.1 hypothetical protein [Paenibacillus sacheonensis]